MSDRGAPSRQQSIDYVARLLRMNPIHQGDSIIRARNELLRLETGESGAADAIVLRQRVRDYRVEALEKLKAIREVFWRLTSTELDAQIEAIENLPFDDMKRAARRLRTVARHRETFVALMGSPSDQTESVTEFVFVDSLKEVLVRSPRDTVMQREHVLDTFGIRARRKACQRKLRTLKVQLPAIYELEANWFDSLCRRKAGASRWKSSGGREQSNKKAGYVVVCIFLGMVAGAFVVHNDAVEKKEKANKPYVFNQYQPSYQSEQLIERPQSDAKNVSHDPPPFSNKKVWQPYQMPGTEPEQQPGTLYPGTYQPTTRPRYQSPGIPAIELDDRYSR
jgi:hypothetical protein